MITGCAMLLLGCSVQARMNQLLEKLNSDPEEKAILEGAIDQIDPTGRGSIQVRQLAALSYDLELDGSELQAAQAELSGGQSGLIHLDEFRSWYADKYLHVLEPPSGSPQQGRRRKMLVDGSPGVSREEDSFYLV